MNFVKHNLVGNARSRRTVSASRGAVTMAVAGGINATLLFVPIPDETKVELLVSLNPAIGMLSYLLWGQLDKSVKGEEDNVD